MGDDMAGLGAFTARCVLVGKLMQVAGVPTEAVMDVL
jgi:hypothetical protein